MVHIPREGDIVWRGFSQALGHPEQPILPIARHAATNRMRSDELLHLNAGDENALSPEQPFQTI
jgi:hypothetical protein